MTTESALCSITGNRQHIPDPPGGLSPDPASFISAPSDPYAMQFIDTGGNNPDPERNSYYDTHPAPSPKPLPSPLPPKVAHAYSRLMRSRCDLISFGWRDELTGEKTQRSYIELDRHYAATFWKRWAGMGFDGPAANTADILEPLSAARIQNAGAGREVLYLRSTWQQPNGKSGKPAIQRVLVTFDLDNHPQYCPAEEVKPRTDEARKWLTGILGDAVHPYWNDTEHGAHGNLWFTIPNALDGRTGTIHATVSRADVNKKILEIHRAIDRLAAAAGIRAHLEFLGGYTLTKKQKTDPEMGNIPCEPRRLVKGTLDGRWACRAPVVQTMDDVHALQAAEISITHPIWDTLITAAAGLPDRSPEKSAADKRIEELLALADADPDPADQQADDEASAPRGNRQSHKPILEPTSKPSAWAKAIGLAIHKLGIRDRDIAMGREDEIIECAMRIYAERGWGDCINDAKRLKDFRAAFTFVMKSFDPAKIGKKKSGDHNNHWFTDDSDVAGTGKMSDVAILRSHVHRMIPAWKYGYANAHQGTQFPQPPVNEEITTIVLATYRKNFLRNKYGDHTIYKREALRMCRHPRFNLRCNGTTIKLAVGLLTEAGLMRSTDFAKPEIHRATQWDLSAALPLLHDEAGQRAYEEQQAREAEAARRLESRKDRYVLTTDMHVIHTDDVREYVAAQAQRATAAGPSQFSPIIQYSDSYTPEDDFDPTENGGEWIESDEIPEEIMNST